MSQTKVIIAVWLRPSTTEPCFSCYKVAEKPRGERLKCMYTSYVTTTVKAKIEQVNRNKVLRLSN